MLLCVPIFALGLFSEWHKTQSKRNYENWSTQYEVISQRMFKIHAKWQLPSTRMFVALDATFHSPMTSCGDTNSCWALAEVSVPWLPSLLSQLMAFPWPPWSVGVWSNLGGHGITFMITTASARRPLAHQSDRHVMPCSHGCNTLSWLCDTWNVWKRNAVAFFTVVFAISCKCKLHITFLTNDHIVTPWRHILSMTYTKSPHWSDAIGAA